MKQITQITNRYNIISKLGQGGMGIVFKVYDRLEKTEVALKQVLLSEQQLDFASKAGTDDTEKLRLSLAHEFSILATLRHPHILSVLDFGFDEDGHPFYTMDLLEGGMDFKRYAEDLPQDEQMRVLTQMLQALHYLHRRGILHRDLKPDNVLIDQDGQVKVMDFGLARLEKRLSTGSDSIAGTITYMAPELFQGERASVASDLFAVGVMAYEIMAGKHPFEAKSIGERIMKIMIENPDMTAAPTEFAAWLEALLEKDPSSRYASAYDALQGLYDAQQLEMPAETQRIRESFLQASNFVGREIEFKQLTDTLETLETENAFFLIGGESGVGKSRLLDELRIEALVRNALVMRGQGVEGGGLPFQLWRNIVRRMLLTVEVTDLQASILKDIVPDVSELLGRDIPDALELTGKAYQERMVLTLVDLFRNLPQPVVLLLEDLQWASESLAVLEQMLKVSEQLPRLMIVATYRNDDAPDLPAKLAGMTHIKLERLTPDAVSELSSAMLGDVGMDEAVVKLLHSQSEGNIFFLVETVRALAEASGDLERIGQGELPEGVFTGGMQAITRRRLSKVDAQYSAIQTLAAVIGREIDTKLLAYSHDTATVGAWLSNAADYGVVSIQDNRWRFAHDKLREAIIADIPDEAVPQIHRTAAETIEAVYPDDAGYNEALLAHWQQVGDLDKTYHYTLLVAQNIIEIKGAYSTAETLLQHLLERLPEHDGRCVALWNWLASSAWRQGNYTIGQTYAQQAQQSAIALDDQNGLSLSLKNLGIIAWYQGEHSNARDLYQQSLAIKQQLGDQQGIADCLNNLGMIADVQGDYVLAKDLYQQSLVIYQQLGDQKGVSISLNNLGIIADDQGDYVLAKDLYQQSLVIRQQLGDQQGIAISLNCLGAIAQEQGDYSNARNLCQQSLAISQSLGDQWSIGSNLSTLGSIAYSQGDYERATDLHQQCLEIMQQIGDQYGIAATLITLGQIANAQGQSGYEHFRQSLAIAQAIQAIPYILLNMVGFAHYFIGQGQSERAGQLVGLAQQHPAQDSNVHNYLDEIMPQLEAALAPDDLAAALERGKSLDLESVVQELLDEFAPDDRF